MWQGRRSTRQTVISIHLIDIAIRREHRAARRLALEDELGDQLLEKE